MPELVPSSGAALPPALTDALTSAASYAEAEKAPATRLAYRSDWRQFTAWSERHGVAPLPADRALVAAYLSHLADSGRAASTIARRLAAISYAHRLKGLDSPAGSEPVRAVLRGIRRTIGTAVTRKAPATARAIEAMLASMSVFSPSNEGEKMKVIRDRALLLLGFAGALRRSELVQLTRSDLEFTAEGLLVHLRRSKTDQEGEGQTIAVPAGARLRPVEALQAWLAVSQICDNSVFRPIGRSGRVGAKALTDRSVANIIKTHARAAGLDASLFSGHSLRAGFVTSALEHGADLFKVMDVTRHRRVETLKGYDRRAQAFRDHAGRDFL